MDRLSLLHFTYYVLYMVQNLYEDVKDKIKYLIAISRRLSLDFLVKHIDRLPVASVVKQLKNSRRVLKWYLHSLFSTIPEVYNTADYAEFHTMQVPRNRDNLDNR